MHGHAFGLPWVKERGSSLWTPADDSPLFWVDVPAARPNNRLFTTNTKVTPATVLTDPVGAIVQEAGIGFDLAQATGTRRYTLSQMADGQWAVACDGVDDFLYSTTFALPSGAKTLGFRLEYSAAHTGTDIDSPIVIGGVTTTFRLYLTGAASGGKGLSFVADLGATTTSRRYSGLAPAAGVPFTVIIAYNGGANNLTASYRLFIDGVEVTIDTTGATMGGGSNTGLLALAVASAPTTGMMSKAFVVTGDKSAIAPAMHSYLIGALVMRHLYRVHFACAEGAAAAAQASLDKSLPGWIELVQSENTPGVFVASGQYTALEVASFAPLLDEVAGLVWVRGDALGVPLALKDQEEVLVDKDQVAPPGTPPSKHRYTLDYAVKEALEPSTESKDTDPLVAPLTVLRVIAADIATAPWSKVARSLLLLLDHGVCSRDELLGRQ